MKTPSHQMIYAKFSSIMFGIFILLIFSTSQARAQKCKPDYSKKDKIEKKQIDAWSCELFETSLGASLFKTSEIRITFSVGRMDTSNFIQLQLQKQEESVQNAIFESTLKGAKGNEFYLGMKDGDPLKFTAEEVTNQTKMNSFLGKLVTTVVLSCEVKAGDLQAMKDALTNKIVDATRIKLENGLIIEQSVKEKKGNRMMEKAICFFNFLQEKGYMK
jgi:hypothetical protein